MPSPGYPVGRQILDKINEFVHPEPHNIMRPLMVKINIGGKYNAKYK